MDPALVAEELEIARLEAELAEEERLLRFI